MKTIVHRLVTGITNSYLIIGQRAMIVDAGAPGTARVFRRALRELHIAPHDLSLIVCTHGHWDHCGELEMLRAMTGSPVLAGSPDHLLIQNGTIDFPPAIGAWGRVVSLFVRSVYMPRARLKAFPVDIVLEHKQMSLEPYGIAGKIIHTPGHTRGSLSALLDTGDAVIGDLAGGGFPVRFGPGPMPLGDSRDMMVQSMHLLLEHGARRFLPGHGRPFDRRKVIQQV